MRFIVAVAAWALAWTAWAFAWADAPGPLALPPPYVFAERLGLDGRERRADWEEAVAAHLSRALEEALAAKSLRAQRIEELSPAAHAVWLRHAAMGDKILAKAGRRRPPRLSLGPEAAALGEVTGARRALLLCADATYATDARRAYAVGAALLGSRPPAGGQTLLASLVDLETGEILWAQAGDFGPDADLRTAEGARAAVAAVLKDAPFGPG